jgi:hypothetical protein
MVSGLTRLVGAVEGEDVAEDVLVFLVLLLGLVVGTQVEIESKT